MVENLDLAAAVERRKAGRPSRWGPEPDRTKVEVPGPPPGPPGAYASAGPPGPYAVSYTHLTLPTIYSV